MTTNIPQLTQQDLAKIEAGKAVIDRFIKDGMKLGLGSGTTSHFFVRTLGQMIRDGKFTDLTCTATSNSTIAVANAVGIPITDINDMGQIDVTIDGPDEIDKNLHMIKGGGACLLWEKIVAHASDTMITICDESKWVDTLGAFPLPVEVVQFGWMQTQQRITEILDKHSINPTKIVRRGGDNPIITDSGNYILDCHFGAIISDTIALEQALNNIVGVVENGLFTREANGVVTAHFDGSIDVVMR